MTRKKEQERKRLRCKNCDRWYDVNPQAPHKLFCADPCRKEFWQYGGIPRKVIAHVEKRLPELVKAGFDAERAKLEAIREEIADERDQIATLVARFESANAQHALDARRTPTGAAA